MSADLLPNSVRYVKNGAGGKWWKAAKARGQVHAGWEDVPDELLRDANMAAIERNIRSSAGGGKTQDINALRTLVERPSQHIWVTFADGRMWWCTVIDVIETNPEGASDEQGHFWLTCALPWSDHSYDGAKRLWTTELPGNVAMLEGFRATVCEPSARDEILRVIRSAEDFDAQAAEIARRSYVDAIAKLVARLRDKDFEVLIDLILSRTGWVRLAKVGGTTEGIDIEAENASTDEIAFVQIKSSAEQAVLDKYVADFNERRSRYTRMIFAVHKSKAGIESPVGEPVQVWDGKKISDLVVRTGLGGWIAKRL